MKHLEGADNMSYAGSGYFAILKREEIKRKREAKKKKQEKAVDKDRKRFLRKFGLM